MLGFMGSVIVSHRYRGVIVQLKSAGWAKKRVGDNIEEKNCASFTQPRSLFIALSLKLERGLLSFVANQDSI